MGILRIIRRMILAGAGLFTVLLPSYTLRAETVSQKQAMKMAQAFFNQASGRVTAPVKMVYNGRRLTTGRLFVPFYIYNSPAGGFVAISAENKTFPVLGYSLKHNFDPSDLNEEEKALLTSWARDIEMIRYDSRIPSEAIRAWSNYPEYLDFILKEKYEATDPQFTLEEAADRMNYLVNSGKAMETASDIYLPEQWQEMINRELDAHKSVAMGFIEGGRVVPAIVYGRKGNFYRLELGRRNSWLVRLLPSELLSGAQLADFSWPAEVPVEVSEEPDFAFYDSYAPLTEKTTAATEPYGVDAILPGEPVVSGIGGGHYEITLPEEVRMMTIYNLGGATCEIRTFKSTNVAHADLSIQPAGFYFALLIGESGRPYGVKLTR